MSLRSYFRYPLGEAGIDEAGRGCLAGPVFAAAVMLPEGYEHELLRDSKKLSESQRNRLRNIIEQEALAWHVATASVEEIDRLNILQATFLAMHRAAQGLRIRPELLLIDGNRFARIESIPHQTIVGGDNLYLSIAAASILAKTHRDEYMCRLHQELPGYGFDKHKGYGTLLHRRALSQFGASTHHRQSFTLLKEQLQLF